MVELLDGLALSDRFHLYVVVSGVPRLVEGILALVPEVVAKEGGRFTRPVVLRPTSSGDSPLSLMDALMAFRDESSDARRFPWLDGSEAGGEEDEGWWALFQKLNEARNDLVARLDAPLVVSLPERLASLFARAAPDLWSIRSYVAWPRTEVRSTEASEPIRILRSRLHVSWAPRGDERGAPTVVAASPGDVRAQGPPESDRLNASDAVNEAVLSADARSPGPIAEGPPLRPVRSVPVEGSRLTRLANLLSEAFTPEELRQLFRRAGMSEVLLSLPGSGTSHKEFAWATASALQRRGMVNESFFRAILDARLRWAAEIRACAATWGIEIEDPDRLHQQARLLALLAWASASVGSPDDPHQELNQGISLMQRVLSASPDHPEWLRTYGELLVLKAQRLRGADRDADAMPMLYEAIEVESRRQAATAPDPARLLDLRLALIDVLQLLGRNREVATQWAEVGKLASSLPAGADATLPAAIRAAAATSSITG